MAGAPAGQIPAEYQAIIDYSKQEAIKSAWSNAVMTADSGKGQTANSSSRKYETRP